MKTIFEVSSLVVIPFWLLMIFFPRWKWTERAVRSPYIVSGPVLIYAALVLPQIATILPQVMRPDLTSISTLLGTSGGATIAWVHFLAFDLFVGRWAYLDSRQRNLSAWIMAPVLFLILMLGPLGLLIYFLIARVKLNVRSSC